jgi:hypothetical protein
MIFLPGSCARCSNISLISSADCIDGKALCGACGAVVCVVPGAAYVEGEVPLFNQLCDVVQSAALASQRAEQLAVALAEAATSFGEQEAISVLTFWLPSIEPLKPMLTASASRSRLALSMLDTILWERARVRASGFVQSVEAPHDQAAVAHVGRGRPPSRS